MLALQRRIVLEDHLGEKHAHYLLETIEERYFVLLPPAAAERVAVLQQEELEGGLDEALEILAENVTVLAMRDHRFLPPCDVPPVLERSRHHVLVLVAGRMGDLPDEVEDEELTPLAFMDEYRKRIGW